MIKTINNVLTFYVDNQTLALPIEQVQYVLHSAEIREIPEANPILYGLFDYHGEIIPVINLRRRLGLGEKPISVGDHFVLVTKNDQSYILVVDEVSEVYSTTEGKVVRKHFAVPSKQKDSDVDAGLDLMIFKKEQLGIVLIYDLGKLINTEIELNVKDALKKLMN
ncbi:MAG: chemotaxis protein CheW [Bacteroidetes bacterium]|jgi:purine-binding chemotaxis protein CheW|nr:chemotaxis protein CheW [Bacteroidota bacterium]